jgi:sugar lactone lactonase YvrE
MTKSVGRALRVCALACAGALAACGGGGGGSDPVPPPDVSVLPPTIVTQPQSAIIGTGSTAAFTVAAGGVAPLSYQWQRSNDAGATWSDIGGATARDFVVADASLAWARSQLRVRVSNAAGTVNSAVVSLAVQPTVRLLAGKRGFWGYADGQGAEARFGSPQGIVTDPAGNLLVADRFNGVIRQVTPQGKTTTVAGRYPTSEFGLPTDGASGVARFISPIGLVRAADGTLYVGDLHRLRRIAPDGTVSTLAGSGTQAVADGTGTAASFGDIRALALDPSGHILVAEGYPYNVIRRVTPAGIVTTLAGVPNSPGSVDGPGATARFQDINGMTVSAGGTIYVADGTTVRQVLADGTVSLYAGSPQTYDYVDGPRLSARFYQLHSVAFDSLGNLWVGDSDALRRIAPNGNVDTVAGGNLIVCAGRSLRDGTAAQACLYQPTSMVSLSDGSGMAFTSNQGTVRRVTHGGAVTTVAGDAMYLGSGVDGTGGDARLSSFEAMARDSAGNIWVPNGLSLRRITPAGVVTTLPLDPMQGVFAYRGLAFDPADNFIVTYSNRVWRIDPAGVATLVAGQVSAGTADGNGSAAGFNNPSGVAVAPDGSIYVADFSNSTVRLISPAGDVTTVAGAAGSCGFADGPAGVGRLCNPLNLALDRAGRLFIVDGGASTVRRLDPDGSLHTVAGSPFSRGFSEGPVSRFRDLIGIGVDGEGNVYVSDSGNGLIRRIDANGVVTVVVGQYGLQALRPGVDGALNKPGALVVLPNGRLVFGSEQVLVGD